MATGAALAIVILGYLGEPWGLAALVAAAGLAGGALAGAVAMTVVWGRTRGFLRKGPWLPGELTLGEGRHGELVHGRSLTDVRLEVRSGALGDPGERIAVEVRSDGDRVLLTAPPSRRIIGATPAPEPREGKKSKDAGGRYAL
ncbi:MAG: hypothetical protein Q4F67_00765 [Propionibacteriaceae bacterium]|nr:hypothetical protein [Propionibacteriaceae bacterium]